jgi:hypothetical protein
MTMVGLFRHVMYGSESLAVGAVDCTDIDKWAWV